MKATVQTRKALIERLGPDSSFRTLFVTTSRHDDYHCFASDGYTIGIHNGEDEIYDDICITTGRGLTI